MLILTVPKYISVVFLIDVEMELTFKYIDPLSLSAVCVCICVCIYARANETGIWDLDCDIYFRLIYKRK